MILASDQPTSQTNKNKKQKQKRMFQTGKLIGRNSIIFSFGAAKHHGKFIHLSVKFKKNGDPPNEGSSETRSAVGRNSRSVWNHRCSRKETRKVFQRCVETEILKK